MKRVTSFFNGKGKEKEKVAGTTNGTSSNGTSANGNGASSNGVGKENIKPRRRSTLLPTNGKTVTAESSDGPDHSVNRDGVVATFEKFAKVIHASGRPLPSETGDGSYKEDSITSGLLRDLKVSRGAIELSTTACCDPAHLSVLERQSSMDSFAIALGKVY